MSSIPRPKRQPEKKLVEDKLVAMVEKQYSGKCIKLVVPGNAGWPDRLCLLPGGISVFVETKRPKGGRVSPLQSHVMTVLRNLGFRCLVVHNDEELKLLAGLFDILIELQLKLQTYIERDLT